MCLCNDVFIHILCFLFMLLLCFLCSIILCYVIYFICIYFSRRCAKTIIKIIYALPYRCEKGPFINMALTPVYYTKLAAVYLRCLEKKQQQIRSKNIEILHKNQTELNRTKPSPIGSAWYHSDPSISKRLQSDLIQPNRITQN